MAPRKKEGSLTIQCVHAIAAAIHAAEFEILLVLTFVVLVLSLKGLLVRHDRTMHPALYLIKDVVKALNGRIMLAKEGVLVQQHKVIFLKRGSSLGISTC
jgi:hypothetical protein